MAKRKSKSNGKKQYSPHDFDTLFQSGTEALKQGRLQEAVQLLEQAYQIDPEYDDVVLNLSGAYILTKKFKQAIILLEGLSARQPHNPMVWTNLGAAYLGNPVLATDEKQERAIIAFEQALKLNPLTPNVAYNLGLIYRDRKQFVQAVHWFKEALKANPDDKDARYYINQLTEDKGEGE